MQNHIIFRYLLIILILTICELGYSQSKIHPDLAAKLSSLAIANSQETVSGIIMMSDQMNINVLKTISSQNNYSRQEQHKIVIQALKDKAAQTQADILQQLKTTNGINNIISLWIVNAIVFEGTFAAINTIAQRQDIEMIHLNYPIKTIDPINSVSEKSYIQKCNGVEDGLKLINAPLLWKLGITGKGRIASHIDSGVDGMHPALFSKWRGNSPGVSPQEAWFDPITNTTFPIDTGNSRGHGTHTMGIMVGSVPGDTIGVAFDAQWISAGVMDRSSSLQTTVEYFLLALQWVADPDGDPSTIDDVPDVCCNSWKVGPNKYYPQCDNTLWNAIDNVEAASVVVVFGAGNNGSGSTIGVPADRNTTLINTFSVGALDASGIKRADYSSKGPSGCPGIASQRIKPEVVARGSDVRSSIPGGGYGLKSGTSMACPYVAGAICLLRQKKPNATVEELKYALLNSAYDLGDVGEDNEYGRGRIDVYVAAFILDCEQNLNITNTISGGTHSFLADNSITASNIITNGATVYYGANNSVKMITGFKIDNGNSIQADLKGCNGNLKSALAENNDESIKTVLANKQISQEAKAINLSSNNSNVTLYPNPSDGKLIIKGLTDFEANVYDLSGRALLKINKASGNIDISGLKPGIYMIHLKSDGDIYIQKVVKQ